MDSHTRARESRQGILFVAAAAVLWGTVGIATQAIYHQSQLTAVAVGFYRLAFAFPVVALFCWQRLGRSILRVGWRHYGTMALIGVMLALYQVFFFAAIGDVGVAVATLVTLCTAPVLVALLSVVFLKERPTGFTVLALLAALAGTALLVGFPAAAAAQGHIFRGVALALGSATGYAIVTLVGRGLSATCHPLHSTTVAFGTGALFLFPLAAGNLFASSYGPAIWGLIGYVGLLPTAVAYTFFFLGMRSIRASTASILTLLEPLTATILAWLVFDERLAPSGMLGALLLLGALAILYRGESLRRGELPGTV